MNLVDILRKECIAAGTSLSSKSQALAAVAGLARTHPGLADIDEADLINALEAREELGSTGFGNGVAIPHCRLAGVPEFVVGIITVPDGVAFDAVDGKDVRLIVFIIGPDQDTTEHIRVLSLVSRVLHLPGVIEELIAQTSPETIYESFLRYSQDQVDTKDRRKRRLCQVFVQDENLFDDIVEVLAAVPDSSLSVIEAKNAREYLTATPLFAGFWSDSHVGFNRIVVAVIDTALTNETLRSLERVAGKLDDRPDLLVVVQDLFYAAGSLEH